MKDENRERAKKVTELASKVAIEGAKVGLAAGAAGAAVGAPVFVAVGMTLLPTIAAGVVGRAFGAKSKKVQAKIDSWFSSVAAEMDMGSAEAAAETVNQHIEEEWASEAVIEGTRRILEDIDEAALPFLARLTASALKGRRVPDARDKRAAELLVSCRGVMLMGLRALVLDCHRSWPALAEGVTVTLVREVADAGHAVDAISAGQGGALFAEVVSPDPPEGKKFSVGEAAHDVIAALKRHGFASDMPSGYFGVQAGPHVASVQRVEIQFLAELLS